jgi:hypothetical protein
MDSESEPYFTAALQATGGSVGQKILPNAQSGCQDSRVQMSDSVHRLSRVHKRLTGSTCCSQAAGEGVVVGVGFDDSQGAVATKLQVIF